MAASHASENTPYIKPLQFTSQKNIPPWIFYSPYDKSLRGNEQQLIGNLLDTKQDPLKIFDMATLSRWSLLTDVSFPCRFYFRSRARRSFKKIEGLRTD